MMRNHHHNSSHAFMLVSGVSVNMGAPCMQEKSHMREKEFDHHAVVALLKEKMCTVGHLAQKHRSVANVSWCLVQRTSTNNFLSHQRQFTEAFFDLCVISYFCITVQDNRVCYSCSFPITKDFPCCKNNYTHNWSAYGTTCMTDSLCWALQTYTCNEILWTAYWELMMIVNTVFVSSVQTAMASQTIT